MVGKTAEKVEVGFRENINEKLHQSEAIIIHFTDGTMTMTMTIGTIK